MYVYIYICIHVCVCIKYYMQHVAQGHVLHTHTHIHIHTFRHTHTHIHTFKHTHTYSHTHAQTHALSLIHHRSISKRSNLPSMAVGWRRSSGSRRKFRIFKNNGPFGFGAKNKFIPRIATGQFQCISISWLTSYASWLTL